MIETITLQTKSRSELIDITSLVQDALSRMSTSEGICHVFVPHTTAGITINEDADPSVRHDLLTYLERLVPWQGGYTHREGNAAAHIKASLLGSSVSVPIVDGRLALGTWQGIYFAEFDGPRHRRVHVKIAAE